eukprot:Gb_21063 [translate_table: standard]
MNINKTFSIGLQEGQGRSLMKGEQRHNAKLPGFAGAGMVMGAGVGVAFLEGGCGFGAGWHTQGAPWSALWCAWVCQGTPGVVGGAPDPAHGHLGRGVLRVCTPGQADGENNQHSFNGFLQKKCLLLNIVANCPQSKEEPQIPLELFSVKHACCASALDISAQFCLTQFNKWLFSTLAEAFHVYVKLEFITNKAGDDNLPSPQSRTLHIYPVLKGIPQQISGYGPIVDIDLKVPPRPPGYCFIEFEDARDAEDAIRGRDGYSFDGHRLRVELAHGGRGHSSSADRYSSYSSGGGGGGRGGGVSKRSEFRVIVSGLPSSASWQDLKDHMRRAGDVCFAQVFRDGNGFLLKT